MSDNQIVEIEQLRREIKRLKRFEQVTWKMLTVPLTSTSYDGNDTVTVGTVTIDTSAVFGVPVGVSGVMAYVRATWASANAASNLQVKVVGGSDVLGELKAHNTNAQSMSLAIPCNSNGDFDVVVLNANATNVVITIYGYLL